MKFLLIAISILCIKSMTCEGQAVYPKIGKRCPDFILSDVLFGMESEVSLQSLKGKPFILDFFSLGCSSCFASFSHINDIKRQFHDSCQIFLIGEDHPGIREVFNDYREAYSLKLPVAYASKIFKAFRIEAVPHVLWVDRNGIVVAVTGSDEVNEQNVRCFINGKRFPFWDWSYDAQIKRSKFDPSMPLLINNNGGRDTSFIFRSVLAKWRQEQSYRSGISFKDQIGSNFGISGRTAFQGRGVNLIALYRLALTGYTTWLPITEDTLLNQILPQIVLRTKDSSLFAGNYDTGENVYNYSLILPSDIATPTRMMQILQNDLKNYFGYRAEIKLIRSKYWALTVDDNCLTKWKTKGGPSTYNGNLSHITFTNQTISLLAYILKALFTKEHPIFVKSGDSVPIDFDSKVFLTDFSKTKHILDSIGVHLIERDTFLKAMVIDDKDE